MHNPFFENIQIVLSKLTATASSAASAGTNSRALAGIQNLTIKEYSAVAGGPQVENDPQG